MEGARGLHHYARAVDLAAFLSLASWVLTTIGSLALFFCHNDRDQTRSWTKIYFDMLSSTANCYGPHHIEERASLIFYHRQQFKPQGTI